MRVCYSKEGAKIDLDVEILDVYFNLTSTSTQLMNMKVPWRGAREKNSKLMHFFD